MKYKRVPLFAMQIILVASLLAAGISPVRAAGLTIAAAPVPGAIFTTDSTCSGVDVNIFDAKEDVYIDGGPAHPGAAGLPDGSYYVKATTPGGDLLGTSAGTLNETPVQVIGGKFASCYQLWSILGKASDGFEGYDTTTNPGGEYKVWVSTVETFDNDETKTDNFKVKTGETVQPATLNVVKFYDANANGINDDSQPITGWEVRIQDDIDLIRYTPVSVMVEPDTYTVTESMPSVGNWMGTTLNPVDITLVEGQTGTVEFGNLCLGAGGGKTLGFWSNKNGEALFEDDDRALLVDLDLRNVDGSGFDPTDYETFRTWLLNGKATNMTYMLSVQLAAMELNVAHGKVDADQLIYAPGSDSANALGFATVSAVMVEANTELGLHGVTTPGDPNRGYQAVLKDALDQANNNQTFVQPTPCTFTFASMPTFELFTMQAYVLGNPKQVFIPLVAN